MTFLLISSSNVIFLSLQYKIVQISSGTTFKISVESLKTSLYLAVSCNFSVNGFQFFCNQMNSKLYENSFVEFFYLQRIVSCPSQTHILTHHVQIITKTHQVSHEFKDNTRKFHFINLEGQTLFNFLIQKISSKEPNGETLQRQVYFKEQFLR